MKKIAFITALSSEIYLLNIISEIQKYPNTKILGIYGTSRDFFTFFEKGAVDIVFIDFAVLDDSPINIAQKIRTIDPFIKIIGISTTPNIDFIKKFLEADTNGFLLKLENNTEIIKDLVTDKHRNLYISPSLEKNISLKHTILVVDDFENTRFIVKFALEQAGFRVFTAENGIDALSILENEQIDLIITDLNMPVMDGFEFIKTVKSNNRLNKIPILVLTTEYSQEKKQKAKNLKISGFIHKPFDLKNFISQIKRILLIS